jgi:hypothetical protein
VWPSSGGTTLRAVELALAGIRVNWVGRRAAGPEEILRAGRPDEYSDAHAALTEETISAATRSAT